MQAVINKTYLYLSPKWACEFLCDRESREARNLFLNVLWKMHWSFQTHGGIRKERKVLFNYSELSGRAKLLWDSGTSKWLRAQRMCQWAPYKWSGRQRGFHWGFRNQDLLLLAWGVKLSQHLSHPEVWSTASAGSLLWALADNPG